MSGGRPSWMPQAREFSQADERVVQRPEGLDALDAKGVKPKDVRAGEIKRYAAIQASPGGWWEIYAPTTASTTVGGATLLCDSPLGYPMHSVLVDNWTNQWLQIDGVRRIIPPYTGGWVVNAVSGTQQARVRLYTPSTNIVQPAPVAGEYVWAAFAEAVLPPATGYTVPGISGQPGSSSSPLFVENATTTARTYTNASSGNQANAPAVATLNGAAGVFTWLTGFECTASGSTAALAVSVTVTGVVGGTLTYTFTFPIGVAVPATPLVVEFPYPLRSAAVATNIVVTLPAGGAGNTNAAADAHGFLE